MAKEISDLSLSRTVSVAKEIYGKRDLLTLGKKTKNLLTLASLTAFVAFCCNTQASIISVI